jgi:hypothetical protein
MEIYFWLVMSVIPFAYLIVTYLDIAIPEYKIKNPWEEREDSLAGLLSLFFKLTDDPKPNAIAIITLIDAGVGIIQKSRISWWWEYRFVFGCEYGNGLPDKKPGDPVTNPTLKQDIQDEISREIQTLGYILQPFRIYERSRGVVGISIDDPRKTDPPFVFQQPKRRNATPAPTSPQVTTDKAWVSSMDNTLATRDFFTTF